MFEFVKSGDYALEELNLKDEKIIITDDIKSELLKLGFDEKEVDKAIRVNDWSGDSYGLHLNGKVYTYWHWNTSKHTLIRIA